MRRRSIAIILVAAVSIGGCSGEGDPRATTTARDSTSTTDRPTTTTTAPTTTTTVAPIAAGDPVALAAQIVGAERAIRDPATPSSALEAAARLQQVAYRALGRHPEWDAVVAEHLPADLREAVALHSDARRQFRALLRTVSDSLPAWRIVDAAPADELLSHYHAAEAEFGVGWEYLAAINLVESAMGRIRGMSDAGAQGPMQFLPATWAAYGEGDIESPHDAIFAAARYLARNGFTRGDIAGALWNYNHSDHYVQGITNYARIMEADPQTFFGFYNWRVFYLTTLGDVVLPRGYETSERIRAADWLATHPQ